ncbi:MAG: hypothetical protein IJ801_10500 [Lachnospiraceae bacterium]|nr:hypothetical protein [Lachnospiraceae bacterium]
MALVLGLTGGTSFSAQAAGTCSLSGNLQSKNCGAANVQVTGINSSLSGLCSQVQNCKNGVSVVIPNGSQVNGGSDTSCSGSGCPSVTVQSNVKGANDTNSSCSVVNDIVKSVTGQNVSNSTSGNCNQVKSGSSQNSCTTPSSTCNQVKSGSSQNSCTTPSSTCNQVKSGSSQNSCTSPSSTCNSGNNGCNTTCPSKSSDSNAVQSGTDKNCQYIIVSPNCGKTQIRTGSNCPSVTVPDTSTTESGKKDTNGTEQNTTEANVPATTETPAADPSTDSEKQTDNSQSDIDREALSYAEQIVKLVNEERAKVGLHALQLDTELTSAALVRADEIQISFSHTRPDGRSFSSVLTDNGIRFTGAGENIAWGQTSPEQVMQAWMNSEGHRANILNAKFTKIGVSHTQDASGRQYWSQLFTY